MMKRLTHIDAEGEARMVDVSAKPISKREAVARGEIRISADTLALIEGQKVAKGNVLATARLAGIMAAKRTGDLIPLCHQINLSKVDVKAEIRDFGVYLESEVKTNSNTGVEMEALTAVSVAALTVYDMCKAVQKDIQITEIGLRLKEGGKSGDYFRQRD